MRRSDSDGAGPTHGNDATESLRQQVNGLVSVCPLHVEGIRVSQTLISNSILHRSDSDGAGATHGNDETMAPQKPVNR